MASKPSTNHTARKHPRESAVTSRERRLHGLATRYFLTKGGDQSAYKLGRYLEASAKRDARASDE